MLKEFYNWFHKTISRPQERGEYSSGYWPGRIREEVLGICKSKQGRLLEVGCGEGLFLADLTRSASQLEIYGIDSWQDILNRAGQRIRSAGVSNVKAVVARASHLPFASYSFDTLVCINVLFNLSSKDKVSETIEEMARVCKVNGEVIVDIRNKWNPLDLIRFKLIRYYDSTCKVPLKAYSVKEITNILEKVGLKIVEIIPLRFPLVIIPSIFIIRARKTR